VIVPDNLTRLVQSGIATMRELQSSTYFTEGDGSIIRLDRYVNGSIGVTFADRRSAAGLEIQRQAERRYVGAAQ
jgi:hypothetical protein